MTDPSPPSPAARQRRIAALVQTLQKAERELQELTGGQVDAVASASGRALLLSQGQEHLRASEATQRQAAAMQSGILNALPAHIALLDRRGVILAVNESWRRFAAANVLSSEDFFVGRNYLTVCDQATGECSEEAAGTAQGIRDVLEGTLPEFSLEYPCHSPTEKRWFRVMVTPLHSKEMEGAVVMHINVTPRRLAEEALRESERRLSFALESNTIGTWDLDLATQEANRSLIHDRIFGYASLRPSWTFADFIGHVLPEDRAEVTRKFQTASADRSKWDIECRIRRLDGQVRWIWAAGIHYTSSDGATKLSGIVQDITDRKLAEAALAESRQQYHDLVETSHDLIWSFDAQGVIRYMNRACREVFGREPAEMVGRNFREFIPPEQLAQDEAAFRAALQDGREEIGYLTRVRRADGTLVHLSVNSRLIRDATGQVTGGTCNGRDVSASLRAQQELEENAERFRLMVEGSEQVLFYTHDREHRFDYLSPSTFAVIGYRPEELVGQPCDVLVIPDDPINATVHDATEKALQEGVPTDPYLAVVRHKDGRRIVFEIMESPIRRDGRIVGIQGFARDITAREQAREELAESETRFRSLFDQAAVGMCLVDLDGHFLRTNERLRGILGYSESALAELTCVEATHPDDRAREAEVVGRMMAGEMPTASWEKRYLHRRGHPVWCHLTLSLLPARGSLPRQFVGVVEDITERRAAVEQLRQREQFLRMAGRIAQVGAWTVDLPDARITWSDEVCRIHEVPEGTVPGLEQALSFYTPEARAVLEPAFGTCAREGLPFDLELPLFTARGRRIWVRSTAEAERNPRGEICRVQGAFQDITARKEAEERIRSLGERLIATLESLTDAFFTLDDAWRFTYLNAEAEKLLQRPRAELLGREIWQAFPESRGTRFETEYREARAAGQPALFEEFYPPLQSWFEVRAFPSAEGLAIYFRDVTERRRSRETLRLSEERFRLLAKATNDTIWDWTLASDAVWWNEGMRTQFGYEPAEIESDSRSWSGRIHPDDRAAILADIHAAIDSGAENWSAEYRFRRRDGSYAHVLDRGYVIRTEEGRAVRMVGGMTDVTEQQQAAEALAASEREFRTLAEAMPQIVWIARQDGATVFFNRHWMDYTGLALEESLGSGWSRPFHPEDRPRAEAAWQRSTTTGEVYALECRLRRADGAFRWWLIRGEPHRDPEGRILKWFGTCTDIHDLKVAQLEIARANRALRMLSSCNEVLIHTLDETELLRRICDVAVSLGGYRLAWVGYARNDAARSVEPLAHSGSEESYLAQARITWREDDPAGRGPAGRAIRSGELVICSDLERDDSFGPWREAARIHGFRGVICLPLHERKRPFGVLVLYTPEPVETNPQELALLRELADDLSFGILTLRSEQERKRADAKMREQAALLDRSHEAIVVKDLEGRIIYWNKGAEQVFGWSNPEAVGQISAQLLQGDPEQLRTAREQLLASGQWEGELQKHHKSGNPLTILARWTLVRDDAGAPKSILSIGTDVTERKKLELQFLRAQRLESIGTLAGGIAHDLNNLLAPIMMGVSLLRRYEARPESRQIIDTIERSAERGTKLVKQVLSFARGVEGLRISLQIGHVMREIQGIIENTFPKNIELRCRVPKELKLVAGDPTQLHQVLLNLCVNARDAMPDGGVLSISAEEVAIDPQYAAMNRSVKPGDYVVVTVTDSGCGIPRDVLDRIFEPFFTTKEQGRGTGLGLSTVMGIVRSHGGFVNVYSEPGRGSTFKVYLRALVEGPADPHALPASGEDQLPRGRGETVLVVDDEASILGITQHTLESFGYRVLTAEDGARAIALYAQRKAEIALVLTDMMMPVMDGPTLVHALRSIHPEVKIIGASGLGSNFSGTRMAQLGVDDFLEKPFSADALLRVLRQVLDRK